MSRENLLNRKRRPLQLLREPLQLRIIPNRQWLEAMLCLFVIVSHRIKKEKARNSATKNIISRINKVHQVSQMRE